jgi:hypothetical protein
MSAIAAIPADNQGNKLYIKELRTEGDRLFLKYRSTLNNIPFVETEIFGDGKKNVVIIGDDGTIIWRFSENWLSKI